MRLFILTSTIFTSYFSFFIQFASSKSCGMQWIQFKTRTFAPELICKIIHLPLNQQVA